MTAGDFMAETKSETEAETGTETESPEEETENMKQKSGLQESTEDSNAPEVVANQEERHRKKKGPTKEEKKLIRRRVSKKESEGSLQTAIRLAVEGGAVEFGMRHAMKESLRAGAKAIILASNAPVNIRQRVQRYCALSGVSIIDFPGSSLELGSVCGRPHQVAMLVVKDTGASNLLDFAKKQ